MSQQDVEHARRYYETFNARGVGGTQHLRHPEAELYDPPDFPDAGRYVGASRDKQQRHGTLGDGREW